MENLSTRGLLTIIIGTFITSGCAITLLDKVIDLLIVI